MKKLLFLFLLLPSFALAQGGPGQSNYPVAVTAQSGAPSGNCGGTNIVSINISNGDYYDCPVAGSSWVKVSGGSGGAQISGTPTNLQIAQWISATTIQGVTNVPIGAGTGTSLALGTNPSSTGALNFANNTGIYTRNAANTGDVIFGKIDGSNGLDLGGGGGTGPAYVDIDGNSVTLNVGNSAHLIYTDTTSAFGWGADTCFWRDSTAGATNVDLGACGSANSKTGTLNLTNLTASGVTILGPTLSPTSAGTAGSAGQFAWDGTNLYICTVTGAAGAATWKKVALSTD